MRQKKLNNWDIVFFYFVFIVLIIFGISVYYEYKTNPDFAACFTFEQDPYNPIKPPDIVKINEVSNYVIGLVIIFWALLIIEKDIYPNRKKIEEKLNEIFDNEN